MADIYVKRDEVIEEIKSSFDADTAIAAVMALETLDLKEYALMKKEQREKSCVNCEYNVSRQECFRCYRYSRWEDSKC